MYFDFFLVAAFGYLTKILDITAYLSVTLHK